MRVLINARFSRRDPRLLQKLNGACARLRSVQRQMSLDGLHQLAANGVQRIQRCQRVLKNRPDLAPTNSAHLLVGQMINALTFQDDFASGNATGGFEQTDDGRSCEGFSGARFADNAQDFAGRNIERNIVQRQERAVSRGEFHTQMAHFKQGLGHGSVLCVT